jgi:hypothetical protein
VLPAAVVVTCARCSADFVPGGQRPHLQRYCESCAGEADRENRARRKRARRVGDGVFRAPVPDVGSHLPGALCTLETSPQWQLEHHQLSCLHGALTSLTGAHDPRVPRFALWPSTHGIRWGVWWADDAGIALCGTTQEMRLSRSVVRATFGPRMRLRAPIVEPGRHVVRVECVTPVLLRGGARTGGAWASTLRSFVQRRAGVAECHYAHVEVVDDAAWWETVKTGNIEPRAGLVGEVELQVNGPALWLLRVAEVIGLGGRCAYGFGRIRVREI